MPSVKTGHPFLFQTSITKSDASTVVGTGETRTELWKLNSDPVVMPLSPEMYEDDNESGKSSNMSEAAPIRIKSAWGRTLNMVADDHALAYWPFWASHGDGGGNGTSNQTVIGSTVGYQGHWSGPVGDVADVKAIDAEEITTGSTAYASLVENIVVPSVEITVPQSGVATVAPTLLGSGRVTSSASATSCTNRRAKVFTRAHMHVLLSATLGYDGDATYETTAFTDAPTAANAVTKTLLNGTPVNIGAYTTQANVRFLNGINLDASYTTGVADGDGAAVVGHGGWIRDSAAQQIEFEFTFLQGASATITNQRAAFDAGTQQGVEFWLWHPDPYETGAYAGFRVTCGFAKPQGEITTGVDGFGHATWTCRYRAQYSTSDLVGWYLLTSSQMTTSLGG